MNARYENGHNGMELKSKLWIEADGEPVFGRGRRFLLEAIDTYGSINRAAKESNSSYRRVRSCIKAMGVVLSRYENSVVLRSRVDNSREKAVRSFQKSTLYIF